jgi:hypothetical protein
VTKLVGHHHNLAVQLIVRARDTSQNRTVKTFTLRLHRP